MKNESTLGRGMEPWDLKVTYFNVIKVFSFILHVEGVNGIIVCINNFYFHVCYYYR